jgi:hypothetical protein
MYIYGLQYMYVHGGKQAACFIVVNAWKAGVYGTPVRRKTTLRSDFRVKSSGDAMPSEEASAGVLRNARFSALNRRGGAKLRTRHSAGVSQNAGFPGTMASIHLLSLPYNYVLVIGANFTDSLVVWAHGPLVHP